MGSIGSVAIVFGFVAAGFYPSSLQLQESISPQPHSTESEGTINVEETAVITQDTETTKDSQSNELVWLSFDTNYQTSETQQATAPADESTESDLTIAEQGLPMDGQQVAILECSVPETIRRSSTPTFSAILFDSALHPIAGQTVIWKVISTGYSFSSVTASDGTTEVDPDLSGLDFGKYDVSATFDNGAQSAVCTESFELTRTYLGSGRGGSNDDSTDDSASEKPALRISTPSAGNSFTGPSFGGIPVLVAGITSDNTGIDSVELRWTPWYGGLTGYRTATPNFPGDWSAWKYEGIKFSTEGAKSILVKATDKDGNKSWKLVAFSVSFSGDNTKPQVSITVPAEGSIVSGTTITVTGTASDFYTGVQKVEVRTDLSEYEEATPGSPGDWSAWSHEVTFASSGLHQIVARATDNQDNIHWQIIDVMVEASGGGA